MNGGQVNSVFFVVRDVMPREANVDFSLIKEKYPFEYIPLLQTGLVVVGRVEQLGHLF